MESKVLQCRCRCPEYKHRDYIGAESVFVVMLKVTGRNRVKMLAAYRLFQNKHPALKANRAGVQWKSCAFVCQMVPDLQGDISVGSRCGFESPGLVV